MTFDEYCALLDLPDQELWSRGPELACQLQFIYKSGRAATQPADPSLDLMSDAARVMSLEGDDRVRRRLYAIVPHLHASAHNGRSVGVTRLHVRCACGGCEGDWAEMLPSDSEAFMGSSLCIDMELVLHDGTRILYEESTSTAIILGDAS